MGNKEELKSDLTQLLTASNKKTKKSRLANFPEENHTEDTNASQEQNTDAKRPGRKARLEKIGYNDFRTSLNIDRNLYQSINQIAVCNGLTCKDVMNAAMRLYIEQYEKKNGPLTPRQSKISADELI